MTQVPHAGWCYYVNSIMYVLYPLLTLHYSSLYMHDANFLSRIHLLIDPKALDRKIMYVLYPLLTSHYSSLYMCHANFLSRMDLLIRPKPLLNRQRLMYVLVFTPNSPCILTPFSGWREGECTRWGSYKSLSFWPTFNFYVTDARWRASLPVPTDSMLVWKFIIISLSNRVPVFGIVGKDRRVTEILAQGALSAFVVHIKCESKHDTERCQEIGTEMDQKTMNCKRKLRRVEQLWGVQLVKIWSWRIRWPEEPMTWPRTCSLSVLLRITSRSLVNELYLLEVVH